MLKGKKNAAKKNLDGMLELFSESFAIGDVCLKRDRRAVPRSSGYATAQKRVGRET